MGNLKIRTVTGSLLLSSISILFSTIFITKSLANQPNEKDLIKLLKTNACISCKLDHADLAFTDLYGVNLNGSNLEKSILINSILTGADLSFTNLTDANLSGSDLKDVNFTGSQLNGANLTNANMHGSNISRTQLITSRWHQAKGLNMNILHDDDILVLAGYKIRNNELKAAKKNISFILDRSGDNPSLLVLRASIQLKIGKHESAIDDLKIARNQFERDGDTKNTNIVELVLKNYYSVKEKEKRKSPGKGYGIEFLKAIKGIIPLLSPITKNFFLPLPIF